MGHLVRVRVPDFSEPDTQTHSQPRQHFGAVALMRGRMRAARGDSAGNALRGLRREVGVEGVIHRPAGCTIPPGTERVLGRRGGLEGWNRL